MNKPMKSIWRSMLCSLGLHDWRVKQDAFMTTTGNCDVVIAWKQCETCAASKLIHILR